MEYLRTLGSAAVSSIVQKSGLNLPFSLGSKVSSFEGKSIWTLYDATKRDDSTPVSVFEFDINANPSKRNLFPIATNALKKLRTTRHPDVLKFIDAVATDTTIYIMTERVRPLSSVLNNWSSKTAQEREDWLIWGLHRISVALAFLNDSCASTHGNIRIDSVFLSPSGEWKLGGFEVLSNPKDETAVLYTLGGMVPEANTYAAPEVKKGGWSTLKENNTSAADSYSFGILIHFAFNTSLPLPATANPPHPPPTPATRGSIPTTIFPLFKKLLNPNPKGRLATKTFLDIGLAETAGEGSGFFSNNRLVKVCQGLDDFGLAGESEKSIFLKTLKESANSFPPEFATYRVLPSLVSALEHGGASTSAASIIPLLLLLGKNVSADEYTTAVIGPVVSLFSSPDRGVRMALLETLDEFKDKLDKKMVVDKIWPHLQTGFTDTVAVIREATVRSVSALSDKLNDRILNNDLLRHLAKLQSDPEASIRTNACILVGRLGPSLGYNTKRKVLVPAFSKALKDPFVHARVAGLMGFMATIGCFENDELAAKVIPAFSFTLLDPEKLVRDQAFKAMELYMKKIQDYAATLPETAIDQNGPLSIGGMPLPVNAPGQASLASSAAGAAGTLAGWAISSLGRKLATSEMQSSIETPLPDRPNSAPPPLKQDSRPTYQSSNASSATVPARSTHGKGMQLGGAKVVGTSGLAHSNTDWALEAAAEANSSPAINTWGNDDLMDVNADEDDWSAFEAAPALDAELDHLPGSFSSEAIDPDDSWGGFGESITVPQSVPRLNTASASSASRPLLSAATTPGRISPALSPPPPPRTPVTTQTTSSLVGMSKEDKAAEMARRKEERKQRIAQLKAQKTAAGVNK